MASPSPTPSPSSSGPRNPEDFIRVGRSVRIDLLRGQRDHLEIHYSLDEGSHAFITKVLYPPGTLDAFRTKFGPTTATATAGGVSFADRLFCHIALIESLKFIATFPKVNCHNTQVPRSICVTFLFSHSVMF